ncbi:UDP-N-acetylmuramate dehydrogenase [Spongiibacter nanhainus]|uniref:UDP-N-acetylmuramate dehydrogenase n=1 Tax=Spongiibacter nanhainus TaxID=2794344 RepID=UPI001E5C6F2B|nr:UDP-N-acetylmuramate dehydrogenase [Spongiibacter nanhainus]
MSVALTVQRDVSLLGRHTLGTPAKAAFFVEADSQDTLVKALDFAQQRDLDVAILGGGSNSVFAGDYPGLVIALTMTGLECQAEGEDRVLQVAAGENWDQLVRYSLSQNWFGLENLIAIPGSVGAAPIQNIGAYGVEVARFIDWVGGWDRLNDCARRLTAEECRFAYRDSIFKGELRDRFIITEVGLRLSTQARVECNYPALQDALKGMEQPSPQQVAEAVEAVRRSKLPDVDHEPNVGSFFKNPIVDSATAKRLLSQHSELAHWPMAGGRVKLAAAWLVDRAGWRGHRQGGVGVHPKQAIVLVNYQSVDGSEVLSLAAAIQADVQERYGVILEIEPRVYRGHAA